jgi:alpha-tubulin suppressor-like RCC1 family protein
MQLTTMKISKVGVTILLVTAVVALAAVSLFRKQLVPYSHGGNAVGGAPRYCPNMRAKPYQIQGMDEAVSIAFQQGYLTAIDKNGHLWSYFVANRQDECESTASAMLLHREGMPPGPRPVFSRVASSAYDGVGITDNGDLVRWAPEEVTRPCNPRLHGGDCGATLVHLYDHGLELAGSSSHILQLTQDGKVASGGMNDCGQLGRAGYGSPPKYLPFALVPGLPPITSVAAGKRNSMALDNEGRVWPWGNLSHPGIASVTSSQPTANAHFCGGESNPYGLSEQANDQPSMMDGLPRITAISSYHAFDLALDDQGDVWGWGNNGCGQIGGDPVKAAHVGGYQSLPARISGLPPIKVITAGRRHALFLARDGSIWATGDNEFAQLGKTGGLPTNGPVCVASLGRGGLDWYAEKPQRVLGIGAAIAIAADSGHSAAIDTDGHVWI